MMTVHATLSVFVTRSVIKIVKVGLKKDLLSKVSAIWQYRPSVFVPDLNHEMVDILCLDHA